VRRRRPLVWKRRKKERRGARFYLISEGEVEDRGGGEGRRGGLPVCSGRKGGEGAKSILLIVSKSSKMKEGLKKNKCGRRKGRGKREAYFY